MSTRLPGEEHFYVKSGSLSMFRAGEDHLARPDQWEIHRLTEDGPEPDKEYHEHTALKTAFRRKCMQGIYYLFYPSLFIF